jgi:ATP-dependent DNA helicase RecG
MRDERLFPLFASLDTLSGVGPKLLPLLQRLCGGNTVWDLLLHLPDRWLDRRVRAHFDQTVPGEIATVRGEVVVHHAPFNDRSPYRIQLGDDTGFLTLSYFRADPRWLKSQFPVGATRIVSGRVEDYKGERQITHPDFVVDPAKGEAPPCAGDAGAQEPPEGPAGMGRSSPGEATQLAHDDGGFPHVARARAL